MRIVLNERVSSYREKKIIVEILIDCKWGTKPILNTTLKVKWVKRHKINII